MISVVIPANNPENAAENTGIPYRSALYRDMFGAGKQESAPIEQQLF